MEQTYILIRVIHFAALLPLFGLLLFRCYGIPGPSEKARMIDGQAVRMAKLLTLLGLATGVLWFLVQAALMDGRWQAMVDFSTLGSVLHETRFGRVWLWHLGFSVALYGIFFTRAGRWASVAFAAAFLVSLAFTGHAIMQEGALGWLHRFNQAIHLMAGASWLGALLGLGLVLYSDGGESFGRQTLWRFVRVGYAAVAFVVASGWINAWLMVGSWQGLLSTSYGRVLSVKVSLVAILIGIALVNRFILLPRLSDASYAALKRTVVFEQVLGMLILFAVSILGTLPPPS
jgi:putative copper resistance protein D